MKPEFFLEVTSGSGVVPLFILMLILTNYLRIEKKRRQEAGLKVSWLHPPPHMDFAIAVLVLIVGVLMNASVVWAWRRFFDATDFTMAQMALLGVGRTLILFGAVFIVRALTKPDYGNKVWTWTLLVTVMAGGLMIIVR